MSTKNLFFVIAVVFDNAILFLPSRGSSKWILALPMKKLTVFLLGQGLSEGGNALSSGALMYFMYVETGTAAAFGGVAGAGMIPSIFLGLFLGVVLERLPLRSALIGLNVILSFTTLLIAPARHSGLGVLIGLYALKEVLAGVFNVGYKKALNQVTPVGKSDMAAKLESLTSRLCVVVGEAAGPYLASKMGDHVFLVDAATYLFALVVTIWTVRGQSQGSAQRPPFTPARDMSEAMRFMRTHPGYVPTLALLIAGFCTWALHGIAGVALMPTLGLAPEAVGGFNATATVAEFLTAAICLKWQMPYDNKQLQLATVLLGLSGVGLGCLSLAGIQGNPAILAAVTLKIVFGIGSNILGVGAWKRLTLDVPEQLVARLASAVQLVTMLTFAGARVLVGVSADRVGAPITFLVCGFVIAAVPFLTRRNH